VLALVQGEGKARKERKFPLFPRLRALLKEQRRWTDLEEARLGMPVPWVFHHHGGRPIRHYRRSWITACAKLAKVHADWRPEEWIRHRMRYSAVENLLGLGFSDVQVCKMVGMSPVTLHRYHQLTPANLARAGAKLNEMFPVQGITPQRVLAFPSQAAEKA
jgi:integrase